MFRPVALFPAALVALAAAAPVHAQERVYVPAFNDGTVLGAAIDPDGTPTAFLGSPFATGTTSAQFGSMTSDGEHLFIGSVNGNAVVSLDVAANGTVSNPRSAAIGFPRAIVVSPDDAHLYAFSSANADITVFDIAADGALSNPRTAARSADGFTGAITSDGEHVFASTGTTVEVFDRAADGTLGNRRTLATPSQVEEIHLTPDDRFLIVPSSPGVATTVIPIEADGSLGTPITGQPGPDDTFGITTDREGRNVYMTGDDGLTVMDLATDGTLSNLRNTPLSGTLNRGVAVTDDGTKVLVGDRTSSELIVFDRAADGSVSNPRALATGNAPQAVILAPNQPPVAAITATPAAAGSATTLSAVGSSDPDGTVAGYTWDFGDGTTTQTTTPTAEHTYATAGTFTATVRVTDDDGCSTTVLWRSFQARCRGTAAAVASTSVAVPEPPPTPTPTPTATPAPTATPVPVAPAGILPGLEAAKLQVERAGVERSRRVLDVLAPITALASGELDVAFRAAGRTTRFTASVDAANRRVRFRKSIPSGQAKLGTGIMTLTYKGDADTQPQEVRLRAANRRANLDAGRPVIADGRLKASGTVLTRARGVVRVQITFDPATGPTETREFSAQIADGKYALDTALPADVLARIAARRGTVHSYTLFTGYLPQRMRGEMDAFQVLPARG